MVAAAASRTRDPVGAQALEQHAQPRRRFRVARGRGRAAGSPGWVKTRDLHGSVAPRKSPHRPRLVAQFTTSRGNLLQAPLLRAPVREHHARGQEQHHTDHGHQRAAGPQPERRQHGAIEAEDDRGGLGEQARQAGPGAHAVPQRTGPTVTPHQDDRRAPPPCPPRPATGSRRCSSAPRNLARKSSGDPAAPLFARAVGLDRRRWACSPGTSSATSSHISSTMTRTGTRCGIMPRPPGQRRQEAVAAPGRTAAWSPRTRTPPPSPGSAARAISSPPCPRSVSQVGPCLLRKRGLHSARARQKKRLARASTAAGVE